MDDAFGAFSRTDGEVRSLGVDRDGFGGSAATKEDLYRHEDGHARLLKKYGVGVGTIKVFPDGGGGWAGYTEPGSWGRFDGLPPEEKIAVYAAGGIAMGSHTHDYSDNANIRHITGGDRDLEARGRARARRDL